MKLRHLLSLAGMIMTSISGGQGGSTNPRPTAIDWSKVPLPSVEGTVYEAAIFRGKVVLLVNTASYCGFTPQYRGLETLWQRYRDRGFAVLGVPANDFGEQEPHADAEIKRFCETTYGITFPIMAKQTVVGESAHPLYRWALEQTGAQGAPKWNFHKILIGRDGKLVSWFTSSVKPADAKLTALLEQALTVPCPLNAV
jgi:glutathione peroxidase